MKRLDTLRRRFIIINMSTITVMLLMILSIVIIGNVNHYQRVAFESLHTLINMTNPVNTLTDTADPGAERFQNSTSSIGKDANRDADQTLKVDQPSDNSTETSESPDDSPPPENSSQLNAQEQKAAYSLPGIVVGVSDDYSDVEILFSRNMKTSETTAAKIVKAVQENGIAEGSLEEYDLSYSVRQTPEGTKIAFVDRSYETSNIRNLGFVSVLCFILAWGVSFVLVWRLSLSVFRPVEMAWEQQRQFIADASHELKTPLTVILANMHILKTHKNEPLATQMHWIESTDNEAQRMKKLVGDMLLLARNDANEDARQPDANVSFSDLVLGALLSFEAVALENGLRIDENIAPDCTVSGDKKQLEELIHLLLDNACKYSLPDSVIKVTLKKKDKDIILTVHNKCKPLDDDAIAHLFERFYRTDASRTRETGGYGLGLAIAKSICTRHHGHIHCRQEAGGITFFVTLPQQKRTRK